MTLKEKEVKKGEKKMKTTLYKNIIIASFAIILSAFTMYNSFAVEDSIKNKNTFEIKLNIDHETLKSKIAEVENLIIELIGKYDKLDIFISAEIEDEAKIESWMLNDDYFEEEITDDTEIKNWMLNDKYFAEEIDESTTIEDWMLNDEYFEDEVSENTSIEAWMLNDLYFGVETEEGSEIESWMLCCKYFGESAEEELVIEEWMLDDNYFN